MEELIIEKARDLFFSYGLKSISMDDLSKGAGISKKTVYQFVSDKAELVLKVAHGLVQCHKEGLEQCRALAKNAVEEVVLQAKLPFSLLASINYSFFYDLEKSFPGAWLSILQHRQKDVLPCIGTNLIRGLEEGLYREDLDFDMAVQIRLQQFEAALQPGVFDRVEADVQQRMNRLTQFYLYGITNGRGSGLVNQYLKNQQ